jgi:hypothetical protein
VAVTLEVEALAGGGVRAHDEMSSEPRIKVPARVELMAGRTCIAGTKGADAA